MKRKIKISLVQSFVLKVVILNAVELNNFPEIRKLRTNTRDDLNRYTYILRITKLKSIRERWDRISRKEQKVYQGQERFAIPGEHVRVAWRTKFSREKQLSR